MQQHVAKPLSRHNVGGVMLDRPFKIQRLGHFGYNVDDTAACCEFYSGLLGLRITDTLDFMDLLPDTSVLDGLTQTKAVFLNHGTDHHSLALFPRGAINRTPRKPKRDDMYINQISWQCGSLQQVRDALDWFQAQGNEIHRIGRDMPGSNWHSYPYDAEGHINEIYYGMEQIGWNLRSKPKPMYSRKLGSRPELPQIAEYTELADSEAAGVDLLGGMRIREKRPLTHEVDGVLLARPFKVNKIGPIRLWVRDVEREVGFYTQLFGLKLTEEVIWHGQRCVFLRANTEHHSLALYPEALRRTLGLWEGSSSFSFGLRVANYRQLKNAVAFLKAEGVEIRHLPAELFPGMDYNAFAIDPQGHAVQLYAYMEQVGWEGRPRPVEARRKVVMPWPATIDAMADEDGGEVFLGPMG